MVKNCLLGVAIVIVLVTGCVSPGASPDGSTSADRALADAYADQRSGVQVTGAGTVTRILADDNEGGWHQRFILELASGQTLLIAHNIDIAPRVASLSVGDRVEFNGVYEWNEQGGTVHWTHHDPAGAHEPGWLEHDDQRYQ